MDFAKVEDYSLFPWPVRLWFVVLFLVIAIVVARSRPRWLLALWLDAWLVAVIAGALYLPRDWVHHEPVLLVVELALASGIPTGLTALWLARTRRHRLLGMAAAQALGAFVAYLGGIAVVAVILLVFWEII